MFTNFNSKQKIFSNLIKKFYNTRKLDFNKKIFPSQKKEEKSAQILEILKFGYPESKCKSN